MHRQAGRHLPCSSFDVLCAHLLPITARTPGRKTSTTCRRNVATQLAPFAPETSRTKRLRYAKMREVNSFAGCQLRRGGRNIPPTWASSLCVDSREFDAENRGGEAWGRVSAHSVASSSSPGSSSSSATTISARGSPCADSAKACGSGPNDVRASPTRSTAITKGNVHQIQRLANTYTQSIAMV